MKLTEFRSNYPFLCGRLTRILLYLGNFKDTRGKFALPCSHRCNLWNKLFHNRTLKIMCDAKTITWQIMSTRSYLATYIYVTRKRCRANKKYICIYFCVCVCVCGWVLVARLNQRRCTVKISKQNIQTHFNV